MTSAAIPTGRFSRKIHRHSPNSDSRPPRAGPSSADTPHTVDSSAEIRPRRASG